MRWFTRLTDAFSKKVRNHMASIARRVQFLPRHQTLRLTLAMEASVDLSRVEPFEELIRPVVGQT